MDERIDLRRHCHVPNTAGLLEDLGGPDLDHDVVISIGHSCIRSFPRDQFRREIDAPDIGLDGPGQLPLWVVRPRFEELIPGCESIYLHIGYRGSCNDDLYWDSLYAFEVPRRGWEDGLWRVDLWMHEAPGLAGITLRADNETLQVELNRRASREWDGFENGGLMVSLALVADRKE